MELQMAATGWRGRLGSRKEENERKTTEREMRERESEREYELLEHKPRLLYMAAPILLLCLETIRSIINRRETGGRSNNIS